MSQPLQVLSSNCMNSFAEGIGFTLSHLQFSYPPVSGLRFWPGNTAIGVWTVPPRQTVGVQGQNADYGTSHFAAQCLPDLRGCDAADSEKSRNRPRRRGAWPDSRMAVPALMSSCLRRYEALAPARLADRIQPPISLRPPASRARPVRPWQRMPCRLELNGIRNRRSRARFHG